MRLLPELRGGGFPEDQLLDRLGDDHDLMDGGPPPIPDRLARIAALALEDRDAAKRRRQQLGRGPWRFAGGTDQPHQALRNERVDRGGHHVGFDADVQEPRRPAGGVVGMEG